MAALGRVALGHRWAVAIGWVAAPGRRARRSLLLPAALELLGCTTWKLPHRLARRLPHLAIEPRPAAEHARQPACQEAP